MNSNATTLQRMTANVLFYPTLAWNVLLGRVLRLRNWWDRVDPGLIVGAYPFARDIEPLFDQGVRAVVNTCEEYAGPMQTYARVGIKQLRIPTTDFTHPQLSDVQQAVEFIQSHVSQGDTVYVHCKAGRARSATVALCWLVKYRGMTADQAQTQLLRARPHVNPHIAQRPVVQQFVRGLSDRAMPAK